MRSRARFGIALSLAVLLGAVLVWMATGGSLETYAGPAQVKLNGDTYRLNGVVSKGSPPNAAAQAVSAEGVRFQVEDQDDPSKKVWVLYRGIVPDTFQDGREIVVTGKMEGGTFVGQRDSLLTKCPSKFEGKKSPEHDSAPA
jgi:cytochrome c-type biogenesis protein CcmE